MLRSATVEDEVLIGEKCVLMEGSLVENHCVLAPGTVLPPGRLVPSGQLWAGNPAKYVRDLTKDEVRLLTIPCSESVLQVSGMQVVPCVCLVAVSQGHSCINGPGGSSFAQLLSKADVSLSI